MEQARSFSGVPSGLGAGDILVAGEEEFPVFSGVLSPQHWATVSRDPVVGGNAEGEGQDRANYIISFTLCRITMQCPVGK